MARPRRSADEGRAAARAAGSPATPWDEVDRCFREFREPSVRLVERVTDLLGNGGANSSTQVARDFRLVRFVFAKWSMEVLVALHASPSAGFEELHRALPGISPRILSMKLKGLEDRGLVRREILAERPPRVRYSLTDRGWTVAWLSDPVLLFLDQAGTRERAEHAPSPAGAPAPPE